jgi:hypothetical protein
MSRKDLCRPNLITTEQTHNRRLSEHPRTDAIRLLTTPSVFTMSVLSTTATFTSLAGLTERCRTLSSVTPPGGTVAKLHHTGTWRQYLRPRPVFEPHGTEYSTGVGFDQQVAASAVLAHTEGHVTAEAISIW